MQTPHIALLCFLTIALLSAALIFYLQFRQNHKPFYILGAFLSIALLPVITVIGFKNGEINIQLAYPRLDSKNESELKKIGNAMIGELESFRKIHGRYPFELEEANLDPSETKYGPWRYRYYQEKDEFKLKVGDYSKNSFTLWWHSEHKKWDILES